MSIREALMEMAQNQSEAAAFNTKASQSRLDDKRETNSRMLKKDLRKSGIHSVHSTKTGPDGSKHDHFDIDKHTKVISTHNSYKVLHKGKETHYQGDPEHRDNRNRVIDKVLQHAGKNESVKMQERAAWVPESIADEQVEAFMEATVAAVAEGKGTFVFEGKHYKAKTKKEDKLDPVGQEDDDVDNDGDVDSSDKYLKKRRSAIKKSMDEETDNESVELDEAMSGTYMTVEYDYSDDYGMLELYKNGKKVGAWSGDLDSHSSGNPLAIEATKLAKKHGVNPNGLKTVDGENPKRTGKLSPNKGFGFPVQKAKRESVEENYTDKQDASYRDEPTPKGAQKRLKALHKKALAYRKKHGKFPSDPYSAAKKSKVDLKFESTETIDEAMSGTYMTVDYDYSDNFGILELFKNGKKIGSWDGHLSNESGKNDLAIEATKLAKKHGVSPNGLKVVDAENSKRVGKLVPNKSFTFPVQKAVKRNYRGDVVSPGNSPKRESVEEAAGTAQHGTDSKTTETFDNMMNNGSGDIPMGKMKDFVNQHELEVGLDAEKIYQQNKYEALSKTPARMGDQSKGDKKPVNPIKVDMVDGMRKALAQMKLSGE